MNDWRPITTAPKDGTRIVCWAEMFDHPCFLVWKTNPRIVHEHNAGQSMELSAAYFGDPDEMDDYELSEAGKGPTHWMPLPPPPTTKAVGDSHIRSIEPSQAREALGYAKT
jgi:hypothetical protein